MNVRHIIVLGKLSCEVRFSSAWLACDKSLKWLQAPNFAELFFHKLDVFGQSVLAVPVEVALVAAVLSYLFTLGG